MANGDYNRRARAFRRQARSGIHDVSFSSVVLLAGFNGTDAATSFTTEDNGARAVTFVADAQLDTAQQKFGTASLLLDGTGDYCTVPDSADWGFDGQFTVEGFVRALNITAGVRGIISHYEGTSLGWSLYHNAGTANFQISTTGGAAAFTITTASLLTAENWHYVAVDRDASNKVRLYVDGAMAASTASGSGTTFDVVGTLKLGARATTQLFNGHMDEVRITKGVARYASDGGHTVPSAAFPRV